MNITRKTENGGEHGNWMAEEPFQTRVYNEINRILTLIWEDQIK